MERKRRNSGKNTKRTPKVKKKKRTHSDSDTVIRNSVQKTGWFILTQSISAQLLTSEGIISSDDGNVLIDTKSTSVSHVIECVNRHHISAPKKQIKNMTPKQRKVYNSASVKRHRQTKKEMEEKASDCKEKCVKNLSRRFKELSTTEKTEYKTEKQRQRRKAQKAVGNQTDNETHINQDQYKHHCKIRVGLIDLFDVETEAIVIPFYDSSLSDTKSLHQQMRREFSVLAPDLVKKFDTECSKSAWKSSICNYNCEKFFWHKPHEKLSTMSQSSGVSPIFSSKPDLINTYTIHVKVPEVSEKCGLSCVSEAELRSAYLSSLICCDKSQHQSIAFPILGKGVHRNEAVLIALQTIYAYFRTVQHTNIELVYIVTDNSQHYDQIANFLFYVREIDLNKFEFLFDDIQCKEREQLFQKFKFLHIYVANKWKMVMQKAPQKCGCKKVNGTHENLSVFLTKMSHDEIMDKWTLNQRSILLNMKQEDVIESIKIIPGIRKVIMAESEPISHDIALQSVRIWLTRKQILFKEQSAQLDKLIAEVSGYDSTGNESDPNQYNAQLFDEELMSEKYVEEFEDSCGSQNLQASVCMKHFYLHLQNDCAMEQTLRNRQFRMLSISLAAENVEDWEDKVNNRTLTVDEWINEVLKTNQLETLTNFAEDFESDKCFFDTPQSLDKHAFPEYPDYQDQKGEPEVICDMDSCYEYNFDQKGLNDSLNSFVEDFDLKMATCSKSQYSLGNDSASSPLKRKQSKGVVDIGTKKRKYTRKEIVVEPYLSLENNSHTECFMNTIANIIYTCKGLFEHIVNPTSYPHNSQLKDLLIDIFTKNTNSTRKWRESLADNDYHTGQQDIGEIFHFLIQDLSNEIHSLPIEFEVVKSRECNSCQDIQYFPVVTRNFSYLTISRNDTFETLFENAYSPKVCSNCEKCGGERLEKKTITCHGYYHMMVLNHVQKKFKKLNTNHIFNMFGSNWRIKSFAQYEPHNADGTSGHYMAWIDGGEQWLCINDSFIKCRRKTVDLSQMFIKLIAFEKC
ncbi:unnamed protein product [Caenorhabditis brenneri]